MVKHSLFRIRRSTEAKWIPFLSGLLRLSPGTRKHNLSSSKDSKLKINSPNFRDILNKMPYFSLNKTSVHQNGVFWLKIFTKKETGESED